jgi:signal transduction histidine kinase
MAARRPTSSANTAGADDDGARGTAQKLRLYQQQLAAMAAQAEMSAERERRRIAVEVHDTLSQSLVLAKMKLAALGKKAREANVRQDLVQDLAEVTQLVEEVLGHTRTLTFELSPPILYELGLEPALEWLAERVTKRTRLRVRVESGRHIVKLSEELSVVVFQLVRELLNNAVKHAEASEVAIRLSFGDGQVRVAVADNGTGFDPRGNGTGRKGERGGFGLFSIRTRLEHLGGSMHIDSAPGGPTRVTLRLPIKSGER